MSSRPRVNSNGIRNFAQQSHTRHTPIDIRLFRSNCAVINLEVMRNRWVCLASNWIRSCTKCRYLPWTTSCSFVGSAHLSFTSLYSIFHKCKQTPARANNHDLNIKLTNRWCTPWRRGNIVLINRIRSVWWSYKFTIATLRPISTYSMYIFMLQEWTSAPLEMVNLHIGLHTIRRKYAFMQNRLGIDTKKRHEYVIKSDTLSSSIHFIHLGNISEFQSIIPAVFVFECQTYGTEIVFFFVSLFTFIKLRLPQ